MDCLNNFYSTLAVLAQLSTPIIFEEVEPYLDQVKNIIIFGNIGQGKSSLLNKMFKFLNDFKTKEKPFISKQSPSSVTKGLDSILVNGVIRLIDSQGFADNNKPNRAIWEDLIQRMHDEI